MLLKNPGRLSFSTVFGSRQGAMGSNGWGPSPVIFTGELCDLRRVVNLSELQYYHLPVEIHCLAFLPLGLNAQHKQLKRREALSWLTLSEGSDHGHWFITWADFILAEACGRGESSLQDG